MLTQKSEANWTASCILNEGLGVGKDWFLQKHKTKSTIWLIETYCKRNKIPCNLLINKLYNHSLSCKQKSIVISLFRMLNGWLRQTPSTVQYHGWWDRLSYSICKSLLAESLEPSFRCQSSKVQPLASLLLMMKWKLHETFSHLKVTAGKIYNLIR